MHTRLQSKRAYLAKSYDSYNSLASSIGLPHSINDQWQDVAHMGPETGACHLGKLASRREDAGQDTCLAASLNMMI